MRQRLVLHQITHAFEDGGMQRTILNQLDLQVAEGELVAVMGPSGSGKSTFLSIAGALLAPSSGEVRIDGESLSGKSAVELSDLRLRRLGFIFQSANLIPYLKAEEQLLFVAKQGGMDHVSAVNSARKLLDRLGMSHRRNAYPEKLSGGERQRIAIARALMNDPAVLLADEPTASLDATRGLEVVRMLASEVKERGKCGVIVTHDERILPLFDRVMDLENGRLTAR